MKLMRPKHYLKNALVAIPIFFAGTALHADSLLSMVLGIAAFCMLSSVVYIVNDIHDVEKDRVHPTKCKRPIASGKISRKSATMLAVILFIASMLCNSVAVNSFFSLGTLYLLIYFVANLAYSFGLKNQPVMDVTILASGFVLRVLYGGAIVDIALSNWLYLTVIAASFFMGLGKRRGEMCISGTSDTRAVLKKYTYNFLDKNMTVFLSLTLVFYSLWAVDAKTVARIGSDALIWTVPLVIIICLRYSFLIERENSDGDPMEVLLSDKILLVLAAAYIVFMIVLFYGSILL